MGSKVAPQKMQFLDAIKKLASLGTFKTQSGGKPAQIGPSPNQNRSESQSHLAYSKWDGLPMKRGTYTYTGLRVTCII